MFGHRLYLVLLNKYFQLITQCLKGKLIPKGFLSKRTLNTLKADQLENRFVKIRMSEQRKYLYGKLSVLQSKQTDLINALHADLFKKQFQIDSSVQSLDSNDIATDTVDWTNQA